MIRAHSLGAELMNRDLFRDATLVPDLDCGLPYRPVDHASVRSLD